MTVGKKHFWAFAEMTDEVVFLWRTVFIHHRLSGLYLVHDNIKTPDLKSLFVYIWLEILKTKWF